jgi:dihydroneopterin aldolase
MAILAMDQYAHAIAARAAGSALVVCPSEIVAARDAGRVPVLAPSAWLRAADPLPHSWDVTSDSIAAWIAGRLGARRLVLVKPSGALVSGESVDGYFARARPAGVETTIVAANQIAALRSAL